MNDLHDYIHLIKTKPEGKIMMDAKEQAEFERRHGIGKYQ